MELENLLKKGIVNEVFAALGVERGYPHCDPISVLRESGNASKGKNIFILYQFVIILLSRSQHETMHVLLLQRRACDRYSLPLISVKPDKLPTGVKFAGMLLSILKRL